MIAQSGMPACLDAAQTWVANFPEEVNAAAFINMLDVAHRLPLSVKSPAATRSAYESECGNIFSGNKTVEQGLNDAISAVEAELARNLPFPRANHTERLLPLPSGSGRVKLKRLIWKT